MTARHSGAEVHFCESFEREWATPTVAGLTGLLCEDVELRQPHLPAIRGKAAAIREFEKLLGWMPAIKGTVHRSISTPGEAAIEWVLIFPIGARGVAIPMTDLFTLEDGRVKTRTVYFDQIPLITAVLMRPWLWPGFMRYRFRG